MNLKRNLPPSVLGRHIIHQRIQSREQNTPSNLMIIRIPHVKSDPILSHNMAHPARARIDREHASAVDFHLISGSIYNPDDLRFWKRHAQCENDVCLTAPYMVVPDHFLAFGAGNEVVGGSCVD